MTGALQYTTEGIRERRREYIKHQRILELAAEHESDSAKDSELYHDLREEQAERLVALYEYTLEAVEQNLGADGANRHAVELALGRHDGCPDGCLE